ncbi:unnamed protein product [Effrenium voratum]|nr:unnamed protein product [Effrenium voratum]
MFGDGSCLFHSLAFGLADGTRGEELRRQIAKVIREKPSLQVADVKISDWLSWSCEDPAGYVQALAKSAWGGGLEMAVASKIRKVNVNVYEEAEGRFRCIAEFTEPLAKRTVHLVYRTQPCAHYDALQIRK